VRRWKPLRDAGGAIRLGGTVRAEPWLSEGKTTWAKCRSRGPGVHPPGAPAPAGTCTCGLYALHPWAVGRGKTRTDGALAMETSSGSLEIVGIVEAWGTVHVHAEGFRAQYARPVDLLLIGTPRDSDYGRLVEDLAIAHRAGMTELADAVAFEDHCRERGIGISPEDVAALTSGAATEGLALGSSRRAGFLRFGQSD
jgi:hypothetical protein